jgi:hypothetical protein
VYYTAFGSQAEAIVESFSSIYLPVIVVGSS